MELVTAYAILANEAILQPEKADLFYNAIEILSKSSHPNKRTFRTIDLIQSDRLLVENIFDYLEKTLEIDTEIISTNLNFVKGKDSYNIQQIKNLQLTILETNSLANELEILSTAFNECPTMLRRFGAVNTKFYAKVKVLSKVFDKELPTFLKVLGSTIDLDKEQLAEATLNYKSGNLAFGDLMQKYKKSVADNIDASKLIEARNKAMVESKNSNCYLELIEFTTHTINLRREIDKCDDVINKKNKDTDFKKSAENTRSL